VQNVVLESFAKQVVRSENDKDSENKKEQVSFTFIGQLNFDTFKLNKTKTK
jgi:hypothetical protein